MAHRGWLFRRWLELGFFDLLLRDVAHLRRRIASTPRPPPTMPGRSSRRSRNRKAAYSSVLRFSSLVWRKPWPRGRGAPVRDFVPMARDVTTAVLVQLERRCWHASPGEDDPLASR